MGRMDGPIPEVRMILGSVRLIEPHHRCDMSPRNSRRENSMRLRPQAILVRTNFLFLCLVVLLAWAPFGYAQGLSSSDLSRLCSVGSVELSPDGHRIAYSVIMRDRPG